MGIYLASFSGKLRYFTFVGIALLLFYTRPLCAQINFQVHSYGNDQAVITLTGAGTQSSTTNLNANGLGLRISSVGHKFIQTRRTNTGDLISAVQQLRRGVYEDLIVSFSRPVTLIATPGSGSLQLTISSRDSTISPKSTPQSVPSTTPGFQLPIYLFITSSKEKLDPLPGLTLIFPAAENLTLLTVHALSLRTIAYVFDLITNSFIGQAPLSGPGHKFDSACDHACVQRYQGEIDHLKTLIDRLTQQCL